MLTVQYCVLVLNSKQTHKCYAGVLNLKVMLANAKAYCAFPQTNLTLFFLQIFISTLPNLVSTMTIILLKLSKSTVIRNKLGVRASSLKVGAPLSRIGWPGENVVFKITQDCTVHSEVMMYTYRLALDAGRLLMGRRLRPLVGRRLSPVAGRLRGRRLAPEAGRLRLDAGRLACLRI
jgi:hypothetical protein